jgi:hypothetical protein
MFWSCVEIAGQDDCWLWLCAIQDSGYGTIYVLGRTILAHRVAWSLYHGRTPEKGIVIRHGCDNPPCCNPLHLVDGTQADNNRDIAARGRNKQYNSVVIARAILDGATEDDLVTIFQMHRLTAREYLRLGPEGLIERRAKRGVRVRRATVDRRTHVHNKAALDAAQQGASIADLMALGLSRASAYRYQNKARESAAS